MATDLAGLDSGQLWERARQSLAGGVSHDGRFLPPHPTHFSRATGARKWDVEGREHIGYAMGSVAMMIGHSLPDDVAAVQQRMEPGTFFATVHPLEIEAGGTSVIPPGWEVRVHESGSMLRNYARTTED